MSARSTADSDTHRPNARSRRRDAILAIAQDVFLEDGFEGASMSAIAARLGGSKGTLYSHFDSKTALFEALVEESCGRNGAAAFEVTPGRPMADRLHDIAQAYMTLICSDWAIRMFQVVAAEALRRPGAGRIFWDTGPAMAIERLSAQIEEFVAAGELLVTDSRVAAETFLTLCRGTPHLRRMLGQSPVPTPMDITAEATSAVALFLRLYRA